MKMTVAELVEITHRAAERGRQSADPGNGRVAELEKECGGLCALMVEAREEREIAEERADKAEARVAELEAEVESLVTDAANGDSMREILAENERQRVEIDRLKQPANDYSRMMLDSVARLAVIEKDAELGRLVRAMPNGATLFYRGDYVTDPWYVSQAGARAPSVGDTPEEALRAAGLTVEVET